MASPTDSVSMQSMRLKVLYTFDAESKNNCLARWPHVLEINTAFVEDSTQIGVIDLKTCLQALASASPELLSQDALDYTIYAYDYSEEGTPLSGQGMLSSVFHPNTQISPEDGLSKVVTGRVTKNVLGLFPGSGSETLEVKLRLLPVAKQGQPQGQVAGQGMSDRDSKTVIGQAWPNSASYSRQRSTGSVSPVDAIDLENMQRMLHEGSAPRELSGNRSSESLRASSNSRPGSRAGTPGASQTLDAQRQSFSHAARPDSRASMRASAQPVFHRRRESFSSGYYSGDEIQMEEGPQRKRVRVTQVGAPSRSDLNIERQPESLRMAASTASSVRVHRPVAMNSTLSNLQAGNLTEAPVRPPTPIPGAKKPTGRRQQIEPTSLRRGSQQYNALNISHAGPLLTDTVEASAGSPEFTRVPSVSSTPANMPSSPPVMANYGSMPSSPLLPAPPQEHHDSGFMSGFDEIAPEDDIFHDLVQAGDRDDFQLQPGNDQSAASDLPNQFIPVFEDINNFGTDAAQIALPPPSKPVDKSASSKRPISRAQSSRPAVRPSMSSPKLAPAPYPRARQLEEEMAAQSNFLPVVASDPVGHPLHRANTWAGEMSDAPTSDAPTGEGGRARPVSSKKVGREQTKARCENAVANGEMPPYCVNCGTIDTPAWRRVFARTFPAHLFDSVQLWPESPGAFVWKGSVQEGEDGTRSFKAYKLSKTPEDKGDEWENVTLCNPCGLWFHKNKCMRPEEKWNKNPKDPHQKKKRTNRPKSKRVAAKKGQDDDSKSEAAEPGSEGSSPADGATEAEMEIDNDAQKPETETADSELPPNLGHAPNEGSVMTANNVAPESRLPAEIEPRAFQPSQIGSEGSHSHPVQVDMTPKPLRRQLFPSPTKHGASSSQPSPPPKDNSADALVELPNICRRSPRLIRSTDVISARPRTPDPTDKENQVPCKVHEDDLNDLFNDEEDGFQLPPQTPTPARRSDRLLLKTPNRTPSARPFTTPGAHTSPTAHRGSSNPKTPKRDFIMGSNRTVEEMTPFTRLMHEDLIKDAVATKKKIAADGHRQPVGNSPTQHTFVEFPDLPSLSGTSPTSCPFASLDTVDLSSMMNEYPDMFRTNLPMDTSPSNGFYNFLNSDFIDASLGTGPWDAAEQMKAPTHPTTGDSLAVQGTGELRRSPRKNKSGWNGG